MDHTFVIHNGVHRRKYKGGLTHSDIIHKFNTLKFVKGSGCVNATHVLTPMSVHKPSSKFLSKHPHLNNSDLWVNLDFISQLHENNKRQGSTKNTEEQNNIKDVGG